MRINKKLFECLHGGFTFIIEKITYDDSEDLYYIFEIKEKGIVLSSMTEYGIREIKEDMKSYIMFFYDMIFEYTEKTIMSGSTMAKDKINSFHGEKTINAFYAYVCSGIGKPLTRTSLGELEEKDLEYIKRLKYYFSFLICKIIEINKTKGALTYEEFKFDENIKNVGVMAKKYIEDNKLDSNIRQKETYVHYMITKEMIATRKKQEQIVVPITQITQLPILQPKHRVRCTKVGNHTTIKEGKYYAVWLPIQPNQNGDSMIGVVDDFGSSRIYPADFFTKETIDVIDVNMNTQILFKDISVGREFYYENKRFIKIDNPIKLLNNVTVREMKYDVEEKSIMRINNSNGITPNAVCLLTFSFFFFSGRSLCEAPYLDNTERIVKFKDIKVASIFSVRKEWVPIYMKIYEIQSFVGGDDMVNTVNAINCKHGNTTNIMDDEECIEFPRAVMRIKG